MNFHQPRPLLGIIFIIVGSLIFVSALGDLLFRLIIALFALGLINYGMYLYNRSSIYIFSNRWIFRR